MKLKLIGFSLVIALMLSAGMGSALTLDQGKSQSDVQVDTGSFTVKVVGGNTPMYFFWANANNQTKYKVQFNSIFEATDSQSNGTQGVFDLGTDSRVAGSMIQLASQDWTFSAINNESNGDVHFTMNTTTNDGVEIIFQNHLYANQDSQLKFDVIINNYDFTSNDTLLVMDFKVLQSGGSGDQSADTNQNGNSVSFGDGFFNIADTADAGGSSIGVGLSTASESGNSKIYVAYENFNGNDLVHDPTVGVQTSATNPNDTTGGDGPSLASDEITYSWVRGLSKGAASASIFFASIIALLVPVAIYRRRFR